MLPALNILKGLIKFSDSDFVATGWQQRQRTLCIFCVIKESHWTFQDVLPTMYMITSVGNYAFKLDANISCPQLCTSVGQTVCRCRVASVWSSESNTRLRLTQWSRRHKSVGCERSLSACQTGALKNDCHNCPSRRGRKKAFDFTALHTLYRGADWHLELTLSL